jgi:uncharacterized protein GlcG (DUF336 family)
MNISLEQANVVIKAAQEKARQLNVLRNVAIKNKKGEIVGAIGASGSTAENDHLVAQAGADAIK